MKPLKCAENNKLWIRDILVRFRIRTTDLRIQIQILLFSGWQFHDVNKNFFGLLLFEGTLYFFTSVYGTMIKSHKEITKQ
jgi:hypothetical protein